MPEETVDRLDDAAERYLRSRSNLVRAVLERWLEAGDTSGLARDTRAQLTAQHEGAPADEHPQGECRSAR
ncbi:MAG TPA: hypothetical protein VMU67_13895 [Steroidobacteraceae bacterium]|nr:hypothetical protein [Steroidobacteraceae bacterium]